MAHIISVTCFNQTHIEKYWCNNTTVNGTENTIIIILLYL